MKDAVVLLAASLLLVLSPILAVAQIPLGSTFVSGGGPPPGTIDITNPPPATGLAKAFCNNSNDDQPAFQAAINYVSNQANGYSTITVPANVTCLLNTIQVNQLPNFTITLVMAPNVTLQGLGTGASRPTLLQGPGGRPAPCSYNCTPYMIGFNRGPRWDKQGTGAFKAINPVAAGASFVTVQTLADANSFNAGDYAVVIGQNPNLPGCQGSPCDIMEEEFHTVQSVNTSNGQITLVDPIDWTYPPPGTTGRQPYIITANAGALTHVTFKNFVVRGAAGELTDQLVYSDIENCDFINDATIGAWSFTDQGNAQEYTTFKNNLIQILGSGSSSGISRDNPQRSSAYNTFDSNTYGESAGHTYCCWGEAEFPRHETYTNNTIWTNPGTSAPVDGFDVSGLHIKIGGLTVGSANTFNEVAGGNWNQSSLTGMILDDVPATTNEGQNADLFRGDVQIIGNTILNCVASGAYCINLDGTGNSASTSSGMGNTVNNNTITIINNNNANGIGTNRGATTAIINNNTINVGSGVGINWGTGMNTPCSVQGNTTVPAGRYGTLPGSPCIVSGNN